MISNSSLLNKEIKEIQKISKAIFNIRKIVLINIHELNRMP